jgi:Ni/Co efflux regulator RcnB
MRKLLVSLLLAGAAATPAIAGPHNWSDRQSSREDRQSAREERQSSAREDRQSSRDERADARADSRPDRPSNFAGSNNFDRSQLARPNGGAPQVELRQQAFTGGGGERADARPDRGNFGGNADVHAAPPPRVVYAPRGQQRSQFGDRRVNDRNQARDQRIRDREVRQQDIRDVRELRQSNRPVPNVMRDRHPPVVSNTPRPGTQPPLRTEARRHPEVQWSTNWRNNHRYDWRNYRHHHRSHFHLGFYFDPFGWGYSPFQIGWRLWPAYYSNRYWINDPWSYRLPYAPAGYQWVRYWNDALLVDTWTGEVVDVIPNFFW